MSLIIGVAKSMYLAELQAVNFRSYRQCDCLWHPRLNAIVGANGQGKTNVLDMVYYLSLCKSPGGLPDSASVHHGQEFFTLFGRYDHQGQEHTVGLRNPLTGAKSVQYDGKPCPRLSDHIGQIALVAIYPHDAELITDGGDLRRRFMNVAIAQYSPTYLTSLTALERALAQRNAYLKNDAIQPTLLEALDAQIAPLGTAIHQARMQLCERLNPLFSEIYSQIGAPDERVSLGYISQLNDADYSQLLRGSWDKDRTLMYTTVGPQRDTMDLRINGEPIRREGSQGQQKCFTIALRLALFALLRERCGYPPILLLDDLFDRLDGDRAASLLQLLAEGDYGQIFLTDTKAEQVSTLIAPWAGMGAMYRVQRKALEKERDL